MYEHLQLKSYRRDRPGIEREEKRENRMTDEEKRASGKAKKVQDQEVEEKSFIKNKSRTTKRTSYLSVLEPEDKGGWL